MCFHISITKNKPRELEDRFNATFEYPEVYDPYYHFVGFEKKHLYIITQEDPETIVPSLWGVLPENFDLSQRSERLKKANTLNAVGENIHKTYSYKDLIGWQRCLIIADGLFEPHKVEGFKGSIPHYFKYKDHGLFAFGGVYNIVDDSTTTPIYSASIITREANNLFKKIHNSPKKINGKLSYRMPLILDETDEYDWLNCNDDMDEVNTLINTFTKKEFISHPVHRDLYRNNVNSNRPDIIKPVHYDAL